MGAIHSSGSESVAMTLEIPVNLSLAAADRILTLELWPQFKAMLEQVERLTPQLHSVSVSFDDQTRPSDPMILIIAETDQFDSEVPDLAGGSPAWRWDRWAAETFSGDVLRHFCMMVVPTGDIVSDGR